MKIQAIRRVRPANPAPEWLYQPTQWAVVSLGSLLGAGLTNKFNQTEIPKRSTLFWILMTHIGQRVYHDPKPCRSKS